MAVPVPRTHGLRPAWAAQACRQDPVAWAVLTVLFVKRMKSTEHDGISTRVRVLEATCGSTARLCVPGSQARLQLLALPSPVGRVCVSFRCLPPQRRPAWLRRVVGLGLSCRQRVSAPPTLCPFDDWKAWTNVDTCGTVPLLWTGLWASHSRSPTIPGAENTLVVSSAAVECGFQHWVRHSICIWGGCVCVFICMKLRNSSVRAERLKYL